MSAETNATAAAGIPAMIIHLPNQDQIKHLRGALLKESEEEPCAHVMTITKKPTGMPQQKLAEITFFLNNIDDKPDGNDAVDATAELHHDDLSNEPAAAPEACVVAADPIPIQPCVLAAATTDDPPAGRSPKEDPSSSQSSSNDENDTPPKIQCYFHTDTRDTVSTASSESYSDESTCSMEDDPVLNCLLKKLDRWACTDPNYDYLDDFELEQYDVIDFLKYAIKQDQNEELKAFGKRYAWAAFAPSDDDDEEAVSSSSSAKPRLPFAKLYALLKQQSQLMTPFIEWADKQIADIAFKNNIAELKKALKSNNMIPINGFLQETAKYADAYLDQVINDTFAIRTYTYMDERFITLCETFKNPLTQMAVLYVRAYLALTTSLKHQAKFNNTNNDNKQTVLKDEEDDDESSSDDDEVEIEAIKTAFKIPQDFLDDIRETKKISDVISQQQPQPPQQLLLAEDDGDTTTNPAEQLTSMVSLSLTPIESPASKKQRTCGGGEPLFHPQFKWKRTTSAETGYNEMRWLEDMVRQDTAVAKIDNRDWLVKIIAWGTDSSTLYDLSPMMNIIEKHLQRANTCRIANLLPLCEASADFAVLLADHLGFSLFKQVQDLAAFDQIMIKSQQWMDPDVSPRRRYYAALNFLTMDFVQRTNEDFVGDYMPFKNTIFAPNPKNAAATMKLNELVDLIGTDRQTMIDLAEYTFQMYMLGACYITRAKVIFVSRYNNRIVELAVIPAPESLSWQNDMILPSFDRAKYKYDFFDNDDGIEEHTRSNSDAKRKQHQEERDVMLSKYARNPLVYLKTQAGKINGEPAFLKWWTQALMLFNHQASDLGALIRDELNIKERRYLWPLISIAEKHRGFALALANYVGCYSPRAFLEDRFETEQEFINKIAYPEPRCPEMYKLVYEAEKFARDPYPYIEKALTVKGGRSAQASKIWDIVRITLPKPNRIGDCLRTNGITVRNAKKLLGLCKSNPEVKEYIALASGFYETRLFNEFYNITTEVVDQDNKYLYMIKEDYVCAACC